MKQNTKALLCEYIGTYIHIGLYKQNTIVQTGEYTAATRRGQHTKAARRQWQNYNLSQVKYAACSTANLANI